MNDHHINNNHNNNNINTINNINKNNKFNNMNDYIIKTNNNKNTHIHNNNLHLLLLKCFVTKKHVGRPQNVQLWGTSEMYKL